MELIYLLCLEYNMLFMQSRLKFLLQPFAVTAYSMNRIKLSKRQLSTIYFQAPLQALFDKINVTIE